jgi:hypothetical protein
VVSLVIAEQAAIFVPLLLLIDDRWIVGLAVVDGHEAGIALWPGRNLHAGSLDDPTRTHGRLRHH